MYAISTLISIIVAVVFYVSPFYLSHPEVTFTEGIRVNLIGQVLKSEAAFESCHPTFKLCMGIPKLAYKGSYLTLGNYEVKMAIATRKRAHGVPRAKRCT